MTTARFLLAAVLLLNVGGVLNAYQGKREKEEPNTRSVEGFVRDQNEAVVNSAIVQLKNTKTLQIRSFITRDDGRYQFHGLSTNIDYELRAEQGDSSSAVRRLSVFDSRRKAVINLKLEPGKK